MDCIFCKIINGEIPAYKIYEDEKTLAFLDIADDFLGHTLVIPKKHCTNLFDADEETINAVFQTVQKVAKHYTEKCFFDGVNILNANGVCAEQSVFHLHIHIIPRRAGDSFSVFPNKEKQNSDFEKLAKVLKIN